MREVSKGSSKNTRKGPKPIWDSWKVSWGYNVLTWPRDISKLSRRIRVERAIQVERPAQATA